MKLYYVFQNQTYKTAAEGQYLWSPTKRRDGSDNKGYKTMANVKKGDIIFHGAKHKTYALSVALTNSYLSKQPEKEKDIANPWNDDGYRVDCNYYVLDQPLEMSNHYAWFLEHYDPNSAFDVRGQGKQIYLSELSCVHAKYILNQLELIAIKDEDKRILKSFYNELLDSMQTEYDENELDLINNLVEEDQAIDVPTWKKEKRRKEYTQPNKLGKAKPKRSAVVAFNALAIANFKCEFDNSDKLFLRRNGRQYYTEPHHLIPLSAHNDFEYSLDVEENIVSLCSHCHNLLHYGRLDDKKPVLEKLYTERKKALADAGLIIDYSDLLDYYS